MLTPEEARDIISYVVHSLLEAGETAPNEAVSLRPVNFPGPHEDRDNWTEDEWFLILRVLFEELKIEPPFTIKSLVELPPDETWQFRLSNSVCLFAALDETGQADFYVTRPGPVGEKDDSR